VSNQSSFRGVDELPIVLSVIQLAQVLGVSRSTAYALIASGEVRAVRVHGRRLVIPKTAVQDFLECRSPINPITDNDSR